MFQNNEAQQFQKAAQAWLLEMNLINNPQMVNILKMNVIMVSDHIKECEMILSIEHSSILIWIDVPGRFTRWWLGKKGLKLLCVEAEEIINRMLPSFRIRVVDDKSIYELALHKLDVALKGGSYETSSVNDGNDTADEPASEES